MMRIAIRRKDGLQCAPANEALRDIRVAGASVSLIFARSVEDWRS